MLKSRQGSILFTSISLVAVFLTLVTASVAYVQTSTKRSQSDRWRDLADDAARSGFDFVMGWAQQNIDRETRLPVAWAGLASGAILNPVWAYSQEATLPAATNTLDGMLAIQNPADPNYGPGIVLGGATAGDIGEYVISRQGNYIATFKARVQAYKLSDDQPRQFRIGVVGRVRQLMQSGIGARNRQSNVNANERDTIVAERLVMSYVGQTPVSRYAALIDMDGVRNWVPGEVVTGPVHINRGYVDSEWDIDLRTARPFIDVGQPIQTYLFDSNSAVGIPARDARSIMNLRTAGALFRAVPDPILGETLNNPVFMDRVTVTGDAVGAKLANRDSLNMFTAVQLDNADYAGVSDAVAANMFRSPENSLRQQPFNKPGPIITNEIAEFPKSVRNRLSTILGVPLGQTIAGYQGSWQTLPDGVYVPTDRFWDSVNILDSPDQYASRPAVGGIYIRGNVEVMRMGVNGNFSYYLFTLGYGAAYAAGLNPKRSYGILVNRTNGDMWMRAWVPNTPVPGLTAGAGNGTQANIFGTEPAGAGSFTGGAGGNSTNSTDAAAFSVNGAGNVSCYFPRGARSIYPFNGVVFVDISVNDDARALNPMVYNNANPVSGNIFALGDPGIPGVAPPYFVNGKRTLNGNVGERVATYSGAPSSAASRLTIMATGNIFIQNHLLLQSLNAAAGVNLVPSATVTVDQSKDVLGIVADKQVVMGLTAPSAGARDQSGCVIHAPIAALGDPAYNYSGPRIGQNDRAQMTGPRAYRGSFATEGLMQYYGSNSETYNVCQGMPTPGADPIFPAVSGGGYTIFNGYPGIPLYRDWSFASLERFLNNPNGRATRGRITVFGSLTQRKRGILGKGDTSYDKRFIFDRRLLTLAPPLFPSTTNVITRTLAPVSPIGMPYRGGAAGIPEYAFMN